MSRKKTMPLLLTVFFILHLTIILSQAIQSTLTGYTVYHHNKSFRIPILSLFAHNDYNDSYLLFAGANTGYGFFGIKTSTQKFFRATYFDQFDNQISSDVHFALRTKNGISRLGSYASHLANFIDDTKKIEEVDGTIQYANTNTWISYRKDYAEKALKWLGKEQAAQIPNCASYRVELITLVPINLRDSSNPLSKPKYHVIEEGLYRVE